MTTIDNTRKQKIRRLLISVFAPPALGAFLLYIATILSRIPHGLNSTVDHLPIIFLYLLFAYPLIGLQSAIAAVLMEYLIRQRAKRRVHLPLAGTVLGVASAFPACFFFGSAWLMLTGALVGLGMGYFLSRDFEPACNRYGA